MSTQRDIINAQKYEHGEAFAHAMKAAELVILADAFCANAAAKDFDLNALPVEHLERLRNAASAIASQSARTITERYHELLAEHVSAD